MIFPSGASAYLGRSRRLLQNHDTILQHVQIAICMLISAYGLVFLAWLRNGEIAQQYISLAIISALIIFVIYGWRGVFRRCDGRVFQRLARSWLLVVALVLGIAFFTKTSESFSRIAIIGWIVLCYALQVAGYQAAGRISQKYISIYRRPIKSIVLGSGAVARHLVASINNNVWIGDQVIGFVDDAENCSEQWSSTGLRRFGGFRDLMGILLAQDIDRVYIAMPMSCSKMVEQIYRSISDKSVDVIWVVDIFDMPLLNPSIRELSGLPLITLSESPLVSESKLLLKTLFDKTFASVALLLFGPLMVVIAFLVHKSSPGPIFFKQKRNGWDGRVIEVWKFRSMYVHDDPCVQQASRNDSRITPIGRFIRRTSIDELPQLINVLMGSMSLVGPRPHAVEHNGFYSQYINSYMMRHRIKPGMTGLAQINGFRGETRTLEQMLGRVEKDIEYINKWSVWLDFKILLKTPATLLSENAY